MEVEWKWRIVKIAGGEMLQDMKLKDQIAGQEMQDIQDMRMQDRKLREMKNNGP